MRFGAGDVELELGRWLRLGAEVISRGTWRETLRAQLEGMLKQLDVSAS